MDIKKMFSVKENQDAKRFEFNPTGNYIGYNISFDECESDENNAWISIYKSLKRDIELSPNNYPKDLQDK